ncbi:MAG: hypothetical protein KGH63_02715 [Candidatus Micrarchaeota archaeon]|nr:hypothetical protein [Candidatus Micrarchaeota archaeon]
MGHPRALGLIVFFALLALLPTAMADQCVVNADCLSLGQHYTCNAYRQCVLAGGWGEDVQVRILDAYGRLLPGANVNITWEISHDRGLATTKNHLTDANGYTHFPIDNVEFDPNATNYSFVINAGYGNALNSTSFFANIGEEPRTLSLPVYLVTFLVTDRNGQPLSVPIMVDGTYLTHSSTAGVGYLPLDAGAHTVLTSYSGLQKTQQINISNDATVALSLKLYNLALRVLDDTGAPLPAEAHAGAASAVTDSNGWAYFYNLTDSQPNITVYYGRHQKTAAVDLSLDNSTVVLFDTHPPVISNVQTQWSGNHVTVRAIIADKGDYASGLTEGNASIQVVYITPDGVQHSLPMYGVGHELYEGLIPVPGGAQQIRYTIQATDADGNSASSSDTFAVPAAPAPNATGPVQTGSALDQLLWPMALGLMLVVVLAGGYWYYKSRKPPSESIGEESLGWTDQTAQSAKPTDIPSSGSAPEPPPVPPQAPPASPPKPPL